jgi:hypothetical protein
MRLHLVLALRRQTIWKEENMIRTTSRCRVELKTAVEALATERERMQQLAEQHEQVVLERDRAFHQRDYEAKRVSDLTASLDTQAKHNRRVFERHDFEAMTREQLVSLAEGAINEARRKGMLEAEGLLSRHARLSRETDLELMRGVVREYQGRIAEVEQHIKDGLGAPIKLDTRPLAAKLDGTAVHSKLTPFKPPGWWRIEPSTISAAGAAAAPTGFIPFDQRAKAITAEAKAKEPRVLNDGAHVTVSGTTGGTYILERKGDVYSCTCPAWRWNRELSNRRTCKHLEKHLGVKAEHDRITTYHMKCYCGELLVRGQCQVHTRDWKGNEKCECGRAFASCKAAYDTISVAQRRFGHQPRLAK